MGKRKHRDPNQRHERAAKREERARRRQELRDFEASVLYERVHPGTAASMRAALMNAGVDPNDIVALDAEGFVGKRAKVTGELVIPVTPPSENEDHDDSDASTG